MSIYNQHSSNMLSIIKHIAYQLLAREQFFLKY